MSKLSCMSPWMYGWWTLVAELRFLCLLTFAEQALKKMKTAKGGNSENKIYWNVSKYNCQEPKKLPNPN